MIIFLTKSKPFNSIQRCTPSGCTTNLSSRMHPPVAVLPTFLQGCTPQWLYYQPFFKDAPPPPPQWLCSTTFLQGCSPKWLPRVQSKPVVVVLQDSSGGHRVEVSLEGYLAACLPLYQLETIQISVEGVLLIADGGFKPHCYFLKER